MQSLLRFHSSVIISSPCIHEKLNPLRVIFHNKTQNLNNLVQVTDSLGNKLNRMNQKLDSNRVQRKIEPLVIYQEGDAEFELNQKALKKFQESQNQSMKQRQMDIEDDSDIQNDDGQQKEFSDSVSDSEADIEEEFQQATKAYQDMQLEAEQNNSVENEDEDEYYKI